MNNKVIFTLIALFILTLLSFGLDQQSNGLKEQSLLIGIGFFMATKFFLVFFSFMHMHKAHRLWAIIFTTLILILFGFIIF